MKQVAVLGRLWRSWHQERQRKCFSDRFLIGVGRRWLLNPLLTEVSISSAQPRSEWLGEKTQR